MKTIQSALKVIDEFKVLRKLEKVYWTSKDYQDLQKVFLQQGKVDELLKQWT